MQLTIHRGSHEIGGSCVEIENNDSRLVIDIGMPLVTPDGSRFEFGEHKHLSGQELVREGVLPNVKGLYPWDKGGKPIDGLLISHAHQDHYGLMHYVNENIPFYLGKGTKQLIDITSLFLNLGMDIKKSVSIQSGRPFQVGSFTVTPYLMDHSVFDAYAFLIESEQIKLLYSGDFREHGRKRKAFQWFLHNVPKDIDMLLLEGTMVGGKSKVQKSEDDIEDEIVSVGRSTEGIVFGVLSAQNVDRVVSFYRAALRTKRQLVVDVYTASVLDSLKMLAKLPYPSEAYPNLRVFFPYRQCRKLAYEGKRELMDRFTPFRIKESGISRNLGKIIMMARSSMVTDLSYIKGLDGAPVIYSMWQGYLQDQSNKRLLDFIQEKNMNLIPIHTSGHAFIDALKKVVEVTNPQAIVPIHTFYPNQYSDLFSDVLEVSDGERLTLTHDGVVRVSERRIDSLETSPEEVRKRYGFPDNASCRNCGDRRESRCPDIGFLEDLCDEYPLCVYWNLRAPDKEEGLTFEIVDNRIVESRGVAFTDDCG